MKNDYMTQEAPWKAIGKFVMPLMAANVLQQLYNTVDTLVVGNFDSQQSLSAVGSCSYLIMLFLAMAMGFSSAAGIVISQFYGAGETKHMRQTAGTGFSFLILLGCVMSVITFAAGPFVLRNLINVPESIDPLAVSYLQTYALGLVFQYGYNAIAATLRSMGDSKASLYFLLCTSLCNIILDLLFVIVFRWSAAGVGLATTISQAISMLVAYRYMVRKYPMFRFDKDMYQLRSNMVRKIIQLGLPISFSQIAISIGFMMLQRIVNSYGEMMTASYTVAGRLEIYMLVPNNAILQGMAIFTGQNYGAGKFDRIKKGIAQSNWIIVLVDAIISVFVFTFARQLIGLFHLQGQAVAYCETHIRIVAFDFFLHGFRGTLMGVFQGIGQSKWSMCCSLTEIVCRVMFAYLLAGLIGPGAVWWPEVIAFALSCGLAYLIYVKKKDSFGAYAVQ